ncbi:phasin family protein [Chthonobacter albigriseus]|uniref:phasin family protein n=1 Tax=Chthonobacter albigriseus TaxID=1683161 RepID=UPI0015EE3E7E|nr:phasin family protein [Chthonobacter albigriseus]
MADKKPTGEAPDPAGMFKAAAEQSVDQARKAFQDAMNLAQKAVGDIETNTASFQGHVRDMTRDTLEFAGATAQATFALVERLAKAKDPAEIAAIQKAYLDNQMERLGRQARTVGDGAIKAAQDLTKPFER